MSQSRKDLLAVIEELKSERDAAKRDMTRAFDERNILLALLSKRDSGPYLSLGAQMYVALDLVPNQVERIAVFASNGVRLAVTLTDGAVRHYTLAESFASPANQHGSLLEWGFVATEKGG